MVIGEHPFRSLHYSLRLDFTSFRSIAHALWDDEARWMKVRQGMSNFLSAAIAAEQEWATDENYMHLSDAPGIVTPQQFADDIKDRVGMSGHWMQAADEGSLAARWSGLNVVIVSHHTLSDGSPYHEILRFPVLGPDQRDNAVPVSSSPCWVIFLPYPLPPLQDSPLTPGVDTIVLLFTGTGRGGHYEVVRELSTSREQPGPHNSNYTEKRKLELPSPDTGGGGGGAPPDEPKDDRPPSKKASKKGEKESGRGVTLQKSAYVYEWNKWTGLDQSYAFPDDREAVPRNTERMLADGNEFYR